MSETVSDLLIRGGGLLIKRQPLIATVYACSLLAILCLCSNSFLAEEIKTVSQLQSSADKGSAGGEGHGGLLFSVTVHAPGNSHKLTSRTLLALSLCPSGALSAECDTVFNFWASLDLFPCSSRWLPPPFDRQTLLGVIHYSHVTR